VQQQGPDAFVFEVSRQVTTPTPLPLFGQKLWLVTSS
jgi:hypothetical protein